MLYEEIAKSVIEDNDFQEKLVDNINSHIHDGAYKGIIIFCGNFLLGINKQGEVVPCIPELYKNKSGDVLAQQNLDLCKKMDTKRFDTKFSYFSLKVGVELYKKLSIQKQILLSVDDKYIKKEARISYHDKNRDVIPDLFQQKLETIFEGKGNLKKHLEKINQILDDSQVGSPNQFLLSEQFLVRRYESRKSRSGYRKYNDYYQNLGENFSSCSLEIFHLLTILEEKKVDIFPGLTQEDKVCVLMFIPDACTSSAMQGGLAVSKANKNFEIINVTQTSTIKEGVMMITKISEGKVERL